MALSRLGDPRDGDCLLVLCRDADGRLRGLLQFVPWGADGLSLDLMRGDRTRRQRAHRADGGRARSRPRRRSAYGGCR